MTNMDNKLYLVPAPLGDYEPGTVIPAPVLEKLREIRIFVVEELRTARRYLSQSGLKDFVSVCRSETLLCVAADITTADEFILTLNAGQWRSKLKGGFRIGKRPCVFIMGRWF